MREITLSEVSWVGGGEVSVLGSIGKALDVLGRFDIGIKVLSAAGDYMFPRGGTDYVTDPSSIGARNGHDAMSDNGETFGGGLLPNGDFGALVIEEFWDPNRAADQAAT
jgi:hypothetical protein